MNYSKGNLAYLVKKSSDTEKISAPMLSESGGILGYGYLTNL